MEGLDVGVVLTPGCPPALDGWLPVTLRGRALAAATAVALPRPPAPTRAPAGAAGPKKIKPTASTDASTSADTDTRGDLRIETSLSEAIAAIVPLTLTAATGCAAR